MSNYFLGEIKTVGFTFAPRGFATCDGQIIPIAQNTALFSLLGTTYGGNGQTTFALPNLQNTAPMFWGNGPGLTPRTLGEESGETAVTLLANEMPTHSHALEQATLTTQNPPQNSASPANDALFAISSPGTLYSTGSPNTQFHPQAISVAGGSQPHSNQSPLLGVLFIIATTGIYPSRN